MLVLGVVGFNATLFLGMETSSPVTAALIMGTSPLTTNLLESILLRQLPSARALIPEGVEAECGWICLRTIGPFDFQASGIV
jgi:drug/metabolite transporter (DMT)-like permease